MHWGGDAQTAPAKAKETYTVNNKTDMCRSPSLRSWSYLRICHLGRPGLVRLVGRLGLARLFGLVCLAGLVRRRQLAGADFARPPD